jgi:hypothetical protein
LSCEQQDEYLEAVLLLKDSGIYDEFILLHESVTDLTHNTPEFLPWHRWFIYQFEKALQDVTGKCIYVPYWDWERDAGWESESTVFHEDTFGSFHGVRTVNGQSCTIDGIVDMNSSPFAWTPGLNNRPEGCLERSFSDEFSFDGESEVLARIVNFDRYANTAQGDDVNGFRVELEAGPHALVHGIVGGRKCYCPDVAQLSLSPLLTYCFHVLLLMFFPTLQTWGRIGALPTHSFTSTTRTLIAFGLFGRTTGIMTNAATTTTGSHGTMKAIA